MLKLYIKFWTSELLFYHAQEFITYLKIIAILIKINMGLLFKRK